MRHSIRTRLLTSTTGAVALIATFGLMAAVSCSNADTDELDDASSSADRVAVIAAHRLLVAAYEANDSAAFGELLDDSPELLIFHPQLESRYAGIDKARKGFQRMFARLGPAEWTEVHSAVTVHGDVAWHTSHIVLEAENLEEAFVGRGTEIWVRRPGGWKLTHGHWSTHPKYEI